MTTKTKTLLVLGAICTALSLAMFLTPLIGEHWALVLGLSGGFTFFAFAFEHWRRALSMASSFFIGFAGVSYFRYVRQDVSGVMVGVAALAIGWAIMWMATRKPSVN